MNPRQAAAVSAGPAAMAGAAVSAPYLAASGYSLAALSIFWFFSPVCHQDPARSCWLAGAPVAVCARCLGIYLGAAVGAWIPSQRRTLLFALFAAVTANLVDVMTEAVAWHGNWRMVRFLLGALAGVAAGSLMANSLKQEARLRLPNLPVDQSAR